MIFNISNGLSPKYTRQAETITPGDSEVVIPADTYLEGALTIAADIKAGLYAWKKSSVSKVIKDPDNTSSSLFADGVALTCYTGVAIENNEIVGTGAMTITLSNSTYSQFVGKYYNENGKLVHIRSQKNTNTFNYSILYLDNEYTFLNYVVSDNENAYPDGAVHTNGYYYEKVVEGLDIDLSALGCTAYEMGSIKLTSSTTNFTINHSLGVIPKYVILYANSTSDKMVTSFISIRYNNASNSRSVMGYRNYSGTLTSDTNAATTLSDTSVTFKTNSASASFQPYINHNYLLLG